MNNKLNQLCCIPLLFVATSCFSEEQEGFYFATFKWLPKLTLQQQRNDNVLSSEENAKTSNITLLSPSLGIEADRKYTQYSLLYNADKAEYINSHADDFLDQRLQANLQMAFSSRSRLKTSAKYYFLHQNRGTGYSQGIGAVLDRPDKYNIRELGGIYSYGTQESNGRIELGLDFSVQRFENRRATIFLGNRNHLDSHFTFYYRVRPKTSLLVEVRNTEIDYRVEAGEPTLDNNEKRFLLGASWNVTAITQGLAKFGVLRKDFVNKSRQDFTGFSWQLGARWRPWTYSRFEIKTLGGTDETIGAGDFIESQSAQLGWQHDWSAPLTTLLQGSVTRNTFHPTGLAEGIVSVGLRLDYKMRYWLEFGVGLTHTERLSNLIGQDYKQNLLSLEMSVKI